MVRKILGWVKGHLIAVISVVLIVVSLPLAYAFSSSMGKSAREDLQKKVEGEFKKVDRQNVSYQVPVFAPGMERVELSRPPNARVTAWFREQIEALSAEAARVSGEALAFNRRGHEVLVEGLFPKPQNEDDRRLKPYEFLRQLYEWRGRPSIGVRLAERVQGGMPPESLRVATKLQDERTRFIADLERQRGPGQQLSAQEQEAMTAHLRQARIDEYVRQARRLGVYVDPAKLDEAVEVSAVEPATPPSLSELFEKQWNIWILEDVLDAIALANTDDRGRAMRVDEAIVKRIVDIAVRIGGSGGGDSYSNLYYAGEATVADRASRGEQAGIVGTDPQISLSGRFSNPGNQVYDVVEVKLELIVDAERLPRLFQAFGEVNFMSVLDVDLEAVDVWKDLDEGFVYGDGSIMKATLIVETIWLREWTAPLMPSAFAAGLGVEDVGKDD